MSGNEQTPRFDPQFACDVSVSRVKRHTIIAHSLLRTRELRLGLQIMTFEQLAARLAGGLAQPVEDDALREAITAELPETALGELDGIKEWLQGEVAKACGPPKSAKELACENLARVIEGARSRRNDKGVDYWTQRATEISR